MTHLDRAHLAAVALCIPICDFARSQTKGNVQVYRDATSIQIRHAVGVVLRRAKWRTGQMSFPEIQYAVGYNSHATVIVACKRPIPPEWAERIDAAVQAINETERVSFAHG